MGVVGGMKITVVVAVTIGVLVAIIIAGLVVATVVVAVTIGVLVAVITIGLVVATVVVALTVVVAVGVGTIIGTGGTIHTGFVTVLESIVTAPLRASTRPSTFAPVVIVADVKEIIVPLKIEFVPSVAELPTCQMILQA